MSKISIILSDLKSAEPLLDQSENILVLSSYDYLYLCNKGKKPEFLANYLQNHDFEASFRKLYLLSKRFKVEDQAVLNDVIGPHIFVTLESFYFAYLAFNFFFSAHPGARPIVYSKDCIAEEKNQMWFYSRLALKAVCQEQAISLREIRIKTDKKQTKDNIIKKVFKKCDYHLSFLFLKFKLQKFKLTNKKLVMGFGESFDEAIVANFLQKFENNNFEIVMFSKNKEAEFWRSGLRPLKILNRYPWIDSKIHSKLVTFKSVDSFLSDVEVELGIPRGFLKMENITRGFPFNLLSHAFHRIGFYENLFKICKPDYVFYTNSYDPVLRMITNMSSKLCFKTIWCPHGVVDFPENFDFQGDYSLVWGDFFKPLMAQYTALKTKKIVIQDPSICEAIQIKGSSKTIDVLLMVKDFYLKPHSDFIPEVFYPGWSRLFNIMEANPDLKFVVKSKPGQDYDFWLKEEAEKRKIKNLSFVSREKVEILIAASRVVIDFARPGTQTIVAAQMDVPLLIIKGFTRYARVVRSYILENFSIHFDQINTMEDIRRYAKPLKKDFELFMKFNPQEEESFFEELNK